jgi:hypothetical protein
VIGFLMCSNIPGFSHLASLFTAASSAPLQENGKNEKVESVAQKSLKLLQEEAQALQLRAQHKSLRILPHF